MAIKVGTTTVIDDSANLSSSVGGLKTVNGNSLIGSGNISAGASTTYGAVGTYYGGHRTVSTNVTYNGGSTISGSSLRKVSSGNTRDGLTGQKSSSQVSSAGLSGTWRQMTGAIRLDYNGALPGLFVRIS